MLPRGTTRETQPTADHCERAEVSTIELVIASVMKMTLPLTDLR